MDLCLEYLVAVLVRDSERFGQDVQRFFGSALVPQRFRQQSEGKRQRTLCSCGLDSRQALSDLRDSLCSPFLLCYGPASPNQCPPPPKRKSSFGRESNHCVGSTLRELRLATHVMHRGGMNERNDYAKGVSEIVGQRESLVARCQRAIRIAKRPQNQSQNGCGVDPWVMPVDEGMGAVNLWVVEMDSLVEVIPSRTQIARKEKRRAPGEVRFDEQGGVSNTFT